LAPVEAKPAGAQAIAATEAESTPRLAEPPSLSQSPPPLPAQGDGAKPIGLLAQVHPPVLVRPAQAIPAVTAVDYVAPRPLRRVAPAVPPSLRNLGLLASAQRKPERS